MTRLGRLGFAVPFVVVRFATLVALVPLASSCARDVESWIGSLDDQDPFERRLAAAGLSTAEGDGAVRAFAALLEHVSEPDENVRFEIGAALGRIGPAAFPVWIEDHAPVTLTDEELEALVTALEPEPRPALQALRARLRGNRGDTGDERRRVRDATLLGHLVPNGPKAVRSLVELTASEDAGVRLAAVEALGAADTDGRALPALLACATDDDPEVAGSARALATRQLALELGGLAQTEREARLAELRATTLDPVDFLIASLESDRRGIPRRAFSGLVALGPRRAEVSVDTLVDVLASSTESERRARAAFDLARHAAAGGPATEAMPALRRALLDDRAAVRVLAAWALSRIGAPALPATADLHRMRTDPVPLVRYTADLARNAIDPPDDETRGETKDEAPEPSRD